MPNVLETIEKTSNFLLGKRRAADSTIDRLIAGGDVAEEEAAEALAVTGKSAEELEAMWQLKDQRDQASRQRQAGLAAKDKIAENLAANEVDRERIRKLTEKPKADIAARIAENNELEAKARAVDSAGRSLRSTVPQIEWWSATTEALAEENKAISVRVESHRKQLSAYRSRLAHLQGRRSDHQSEVKRLQHHRPSDRTAAVNLDGHRGELQAIDADLARVRQQIVAGERELKELEKQLADVHRRQRILNELALEPWPTLEQFEAATK